MIKTDPISLNHHEAPFKTNVSIDLSEDLSLSASVENVLVEVVLAQHTSTKVFKDVPIYALCSLNKNRKIHLSTEKVDVFVKGSKKRLESMRSSDISSYVNCVDLEENASYDVPVITDLPFGVKLIKTVPGAVHLDIKN